MELILNQRKHTITFHTFTAILEHFRKFTANFKVLLAVSFQLCLRLAMREYILSLQTVSELRNETNHRPQEDPADMIPISFKLSPIFRLTKLFKIPMWFGPLTNPWGNGVLTLNPRDKILKYCQKCTGYSSQRYRANPHNVYHSC